MLEAMNELVMFPRYRRSYYGDKVFIVYKEILELQELEQHEGTVAS